MENKTCPTIKFSTSIAIKKQYKIYYFSRDGANIGVGNIGCGAVTSMAWSGDSNHLLVTTNYAIVVGWVVN